MARTMTVDVGDELREFIDSLVKAGDRIRRGMNPGDNQEGI